MVFSNFDLLYGRGSGSDGDASRFDLVSGRVPGKIGRVTFAYCVRVLQYRVLQGKRKKQR